MGTHRQQKYEARAPNGETPGHLLFCSPAVTDLLIPGDLSLCWQSGPLGGLGWPSVVGDSAGGVRLLSASIVSHKVHQNIHMTSEVRETHPGYDEKAKLS